MTCPRHAQPGFRLRRCGCASWSRSTTPPNPRRDTRRKRRKRSHANGRKDKPEQGKKSLTKWPREFPLELRTKTTSLLCTFHFSVQYAGSPMDVISLKITPDQRPSVFAPYGRLG